MNTGGEKENEEKKQKNTRKFVDSGHLHLEALITKNQNYVWNTKKEMNAEIKTNCEKHHL